MRFDASFDRDRQMRLRAREVRGKGRLAPSIAGCALSAVALCAAWYAVAAPSVNARSAHRPISRGEEIARSVCSGCHQVAADQEFPPLLEQPTPAFTEIANRPGTSVRSLERFITMTHWDEERIPMKMPNPMLTAEDTAAVAHYILSLRNPRKGVP